MVIYQLLARIGDSGWYYARASVLSCAWASSTFGMFGLVMVHSTKRTR